MKNYLRCAPYSGDNTTKYIITNVMRTIAILLTIGLTTVMANESHSQTRMSIHVDQVSLETLFDNIQKNSEYIFFYKDAILPENEGVSLSINDATLKQILEPILKRYNLGFNINDRQVTIYDMLPLPIKTKVGVSETQEVTITGTVTDVDGSPLPGANILEKGTFNGVQTDFDGNFSIQISDENAILVVSYLGFIKREYQVNGQSSVQIVLEEDTASLDEVVVIGYGSVRKSELTGSVSSMSVVSMMRHQPGLVYMLHGAITRVLILRILKKLAAT